MNSWPLLWLHRSQDASLGQQRDARQRDNEQTVASGYLRSKILQAAQGRVKIFAYQVVVIHTACTQRVLYSAILSKASTCKRLVPDDLHLFILKIIVRAIARIVFKLYIWMYVRHAQQLKGCKCQSYRRLESRE